MPVCPECGREDAAQKVSAIYHAGKKVSPSNEPELIKKLAPPEKPFRGIYSFASPFWVAAYVVYAFIFLGFAVLLFLSGLMNLQDGELWWGVYCLVVALILCVPPAKRIKKYLKQRELDQKHFEEKMHYWRYAMKRWEEAYYCTRGGVVFCLGDKAHAPLWNMFNYLCRGVEPPPDDCEILILQEC